VTLIIFSHWAYNIIFCLENGFVVLKSLEATALGHLASTVGLNDKFASSRLL
jgi:hypothetical protein